MIDSIKEKKTISRCNISFVFANSFFNTCFIELIMIKYFNILIIE